MLSNGFMVSVILFNMFKEAIVAHKQEDICAVDITVSLSQQENKYVL